MSKYAYMLFVFLFIFRGNKNPRTTAKGHCRAVNKYLYKHTQRECEYSLT